jgi:hypothetical protein
MLLFIDRFWQSFGTNFETWLGSLNFVVGVHSVSFHLTARGQRKLGIVLWPKSEPVDAGLPSFLLRRPTMP